MVEIFWSDLELGFDPVTVFGRQGRVELELGFGKGRFLLASAEAHPEVDFVGVERAGSYFRIARERAERRGLKNLRLVKTDANRFLARILPPASIDRLHVYFPDPWPKKRHHKRRFVSPQLAHAAAARLRPGGDFWFITDHAEYFEAGCLALRTESRLRRAEEPPPDAEGRTNYEIKYRAQGRPIYRARWVLSSSPGPSSSDDSSSPVC